VEEIKSSEDQVKDLEAQELERVREMLKKAAEIKDPRQMWFMVRDILNLLTLIIVPAEQVQIITPEMVMG